LLCKHFFWLWLLPKIAKKAPLKLKQEWNRFLK
jgi:predicted secreted Zn-dependent protease